MIRLVIVACLMVVSAPAYAVKQYNINNMTCSEVQSILQRDGKAQLRYASPRNASLTLYDQYVAGNRICNTKPETVPTVDNKRCRVHKCRKQSGR